MPLLQEFDLKIKEKKGSENFVADHLSLLHISGTRDISDSFLDEHLLALSSHAPWSVHIVNFLVTGSQSIGIGIEKIISSMNSSIIFRKSPNVTRYVSRSFGSCYNTGKILGVF